MRPVPVVLGLLCGALTGVAAVLVNPAWLLDRPAPLSSGELRIINYELGQTRGLSAGVSSLLGAGRVGGALDDAGIRNTRVALIELPAGPGHPAAIAVKFSMVSADNALWRARLGMRDYWSILWLGEGGLFVVGQSNYWLVLRDSVLSFVRGEGQRGLAPRYRLSAGSAADGGSRLIGVSGAWSRVTGEVRESLLPNASQLPGWELELGSAPRSPGS